MMAKSYAGFLDAVAYLLDVLRDRILEIVHVILKVIITAVKIVVGCCVIGGLIAGVLWLVFVGLRLYVLEPYVGKEEAMMASAGFLTGLMLMSLIWWRALR